MLMVLAASEQQYSALARGSDSDGSCFSMLDLTLVPRRRNKGVETETGAQRHSARGQGEEHRDGGAETLSGVSLEASEDMFESIPSEKHDAAHSWPNQSTLILHGAVEMAAPCPWRSLLACRASLVS